MLIILFCALLGAIPGAIGIMRLEGCPVPFPVFSRDKSKFSAAFSDSSKASNSFAGLIIGGFFGFLIACAIGLFVPTRMAPMQETVLTPIHQDGKTFYVGVSAQEVPGSRYGAPHQVSYYSFLKEADGGMALEKFPTDDSIHLYEDTISGGKLIRLEPAFSVRHELAWYLFALPIGSTRYEFHIPPNSVGTF
jgi:hypothetical protein